MLEEHLDRLTQRLVTSYSHVSHRHAARLGCSRLPSQPAVVQVCDWLLELVYPGIHGRQDLNQHNIRYHVGEQLCLIASTLTAEIDAALCYSRSGTPSGQMRTTGDTPCRSHAQDLTRGLLEQLPDIREVLATDVQAAFDGDPAARSTDEVMLCYPGLLAISIHRLAHALLKAGVPVIPRMMNEYAHNRTGIDIHPGATIGRYFFIDHGTGVVIGETTIIGDRVRIYQGVTLGGLRPQKGQAIAGTKRHPTIEDDVVIAANATILGGDTVVGKGCTIGGGVFLTSSVPPNTLVKIKNPELTLKTRQTLDMDPDYVPDFQI